MNVFHCFSVNSGMHTIFHHGRINGFYVTEHRLQYEHTKVFAYSVINKLYS